MLSYSIGEWFLESKALSFTVWQKFYFFPNSLIETVFKNTMIDKYIKKFLPRLEF